MKIEQIVWKTFTPRSGEFRCCVCHVRDAKFFVYIVKKNVRCRLPTCADCAALEQTILEERLKINDNTIIQKSKS